jgi:hypothetical protein
MVSIRLNSDCAHFEGVDQREFRSAAWSGRDLAQIAEIGFNDRCEELIRRLLLEFFL